MNIFPAVDIRGGKCVRLQKGCFDREKAYFENPVDAAKMLISQGAKRIHVVNLDGTLTGGIDEGFKEILKGIVALGLPLQFGGGVRSYETLASLMEAGVDRVVLGTAAIENVEFLKKALADFGDKIAVGADIKDDKVAITGWTETADVTRDEFIVRMNELGVKTVIYTDISRDGMLVGPNIEGLKEAKALFKGTVVASGGVSSLDDLKAIKGTGIEDVIVGKAIYEGLVTIHEGEAL